MIDLKRLMRKGKVSNHEFQERYQDSISASYSVPDITIVAGKGAFLVDADGKKYLDFLSGIATNALGAAHPKIIKAVTSQVGKVSHISNFYGNPETIKLAARLQAISGDPRARIFFCNSGAEANEAAIKISRLTGRREIIAMRGAFHGRTMGALSLTGQIQKRAPFRPLLSDIRFVDFGDLRGLKNAVSSRTAMIIVEPIQGENGVVVPPSGYLKGVEEVARQKGALLAIDAVQTGMGRTGQWFGYEDEGINPDIVTLAKGLGGGLPMGAMIAMASAPQFSPGQHGTTFGGNPVVAAAANVVIDVIEDEDLMGRSKELYDLFEQEISKVPGVAEVRGKGLLIGVVLEEADAKNVVNGLKAAGVLANAATDFVVRLAPPLVITMKEARRFISIFKRVMQESI
ncbi:MAG: acetylornithine transaminase [Candidatus Nanopelagicaceae bacterium]